MVVISLMVCYRGWMGGSERGGWSGWMGGSERGGWEAGGGLKLPLGLFGLAIGPRSASPNMLEWRNRHLPITEVNFRPMPSM